MAKTNVKDMLAERAAEKNGIVPEIDASYAAMFGFSSETRKNQMTEIPLAALVPYSKHPFKMYSPERLTALAQSIADNGLQQPIIVRWSGINYEILAGHNRTEAFRVLGWEAIPAIIVDASDDQAAIVVTETNLRQREKLLPSEKAFAYKLQLDAVKHQGQKGKAHTSNQIDWKNESANVIAQNNGVNINDIRRHIRLTFLIPPLLDLLDAGKLAFMAAVELSYLEEPQQMLLYTACIEKQCAKLDIKLVKFMREEFERGMAPNNEKDLSSVLRLYSSLAQKPPRDIIFKRKTFAQYLERVPEGEDLEALFLEFLKGRYGN